MEKLGSISLDQSRESSQGQEKPQWWDEISHHLVFDTYRDLTKGPSSDPRTWDQIQWSKHIDTGLPYDDKLTGLRSEGPFSRNTWADAISEEPELNKMCVQALEMRATADRLAPPKLFPAAAMLSFFDAQTFDQDAFMEDYDPYQEPTVDWRKVIRHYILENEQNRQAFEKSLREYVPSISNEKRYDSLVERLKRQPLLLSERLVDVGASTGIATKKLVPFFSQVIAVDRLVPSENPLAFDPQDRQDADDDSYSENRRDSIRFVNGDALSLPFSDRSVDALVYSYILYHLNEEATVTALEEGLRVLKEGGLAFVRPAGKDGVDPMEFTHAYSDWMVLRRSSGNLEIAEFFADELSGS